MSFTSLSILIPIVLALITYFQVRKGYKRGMTRSLVQLGVIVGCAFFAALVSVAVSVPVTDALNDFFYEIGLYESIEELLGSAYDAVIIILRMIVSLTLYLPAFWVLRLTISIITAIFVRCCIGKRRKNDSYISENADFLERNDKVLGAAVGGVIGFLLTVIVLMPFAGVVKATGELITVAQTLAGEEEAEDDEVTAELKAYANDFSLNVIDVCGGRLLFDLTARTTMYGRTTCFNKEVEAVKAIDIDEVTDVFSRIGYADDKSISDVREFLDKVDESFILKAIMLSGFTEASAAWLRGDSYMDTPRPDFGTNFAVVEFLNELLYVCSGSTFETIDADIDTLMNLSKIFYDRVNVFDTDEYSLVIDELMLRGTADRIRAVLSENPHMRPVLYSVDDLIMSVVTDEIKNTMKYSEEDREVLYEEFASILNETAGLRGSVRLNMVTEQVRGELDAYGLYIPEHLDSTIAELLINGVDGGSDGNVRYEDVATFFDAYVTSGGDSMWP